MTWTEMETAAGYGIESGKIFACTFFDSSAVQRYLLPQRVWKMSRQILGLTAGRGVQTDHGCVTYMLHFSWQHHTWRCVSLVRKAVAGHIFMSAVGVKI